MGQQAEQAVPNTPPVSAAPICRANFEGLGLWPYDQRFRVSASVEEATPERYDIATSGSEPLSFTRVGVCASSYWGNTFLWSSTGWESYGGGLFLPFKDATAGTSSYGGGRYLLDTVKGSDLGTDGGELILDFNFAYNPSCSYDPRWVCPLAPHPITSRSRWKRRERHGARGGGRVPPPLRTSQISPSSVRYSSARSAASSTSTVALLLVR